MPETPNFAPLRGLLFVRREQPAAEKGGIIVPESWRQYGWRATVLRAGPAADGYLPDETIWFLKDATVLPFPDRDLALTESKDVLAKLRIMCMVEVISPQNDFVMIREESSPDAPGIVLTDKRLPEACTGRVFRTGPDCLDVSMGDRVWFSAKMRNKCREAGDPYVLVREREILIVEKK